MLNDISKILQVIKKGVVIVEDGKPSYVLVPWEDIAQNGATGSAQTAENGFFARQPIDDTSLIQQIIAQDSMEHLDDAAREQEVADMLNAMDEEKGNEQPQPHNHEEHVNLEDLPF